jgi:hypothetical protein
MWRTKQEMIDLGNSQSGQAYISLWCLLCELVVAGEHSPFACHRKGGRRNTSHLALSVALAEIPHSQQHTL